MADAHYYYDEFINNINNQVTVSGLGGVTGLLQGGLSFNGGNQYSNDYESQAQENASKYFNQGAAAVNAIAGTNMATNQRLKSLEQTTQSWTGSAPVTFSIEMLVVATRPTDDTTTMVKRAMGAVMPNRSGGGLTIAAPLNYGPKVGAGSLTPQQTGTIGVKVGRWFQSYGLIMTSCNPTFSQQVIGTGRPLWSKLSMQFSTYRAFSYGEFLGWFR